jgi:hypothetical protein
MYLESALNTHIQSWLKAALFEIPMEKPRIQLIEQSVHFCPADHYNKCLVFVLPLEVETWLLHKQEV